VPSRPGFPDYGRLAQIIELASQTCDGRLPLKAALARLERSHARLDEIAQAPHHYGRWVVTVVLFVLAAARGSFRPERVLTDRLSSVRAPGAGPHEPVGRHGLAGSRARRLNNPRPASMGCVMDTSP
jgi:hypothetical protein